jgi:selenocysteine-specific elongation factor
MTIGGGEVVDVHPRYHRRFHDQVLASLEVLSAGAPEEIILAALAKRSLTRASSTGSRSVHISPGLEMAELIKQSNLPDDVTQQTLETLLSEGRVRKVGPFWFAQHIWESLAEEAIRLVKEQHQQYPLRSGLSKEEWRSRLNLSSKMAAEVFALLQTEGRLETVSESVIGARHATSTTGSILRLPGFTPGFTPDQQRLVTQLLQRFRSSPYTPPGRSDVEALVGSEILAALIEQGQLVKLGDGVLFLRETYDEALTKLTSYLQVHGKMTAAEARDLLGATRKYILPLLEHMDALRITRRIGDERVLI